MPKYTIEHKVKTLIDAAVKQDDYIDRFSVNNLNFIQWSFNNADGWVGDAWIASGKFCSSNCFDAINDARKEIHKVESIIAFIGQAYIEHLGQPFIVKRDDKFNDIALFYFSKETKPVSLMFQQSEKNILEKIISDDRVSHNFFFYWKDVVNTFGYSAKLLLMCSAIEALANKLSKINNTKKSFEIGNILGKKLANNIFGEGKVRGSGIRNKLVHGEYKEAIDGNNYVESIHSRVLFFFNKYILNDINDKLNTAIINPHRHFIGNGEQWYGFIEVKTDKYSLDLKEVLNDFEINGLNNLQRYKIIHGKKLLDLKKIF